jgi:hypothetical protein
MNGPSNIKIQKAGAEEIGNAHICSPASDLERSVGQMTLYLHCSEIFFLLSENTLAQGR